MPFHWSSSTAEQQAAQPPGSPGWPQQLLRVRILVQLLATTRPSFPPSGMGTLMFENTDLRLGIVPSFARMALACTRGYAGRSVPAKTCQASADFAVRLSTMYVCP